MTIGWRTPGAWTAGLAPALPAGLAAGDRMLLFVGCKPYSVTIDEPAGWTRIGTQQTNGTVANGVDTGSVTWSVFYRDWVSGDAAPSVSVTGVSVSLSCIHAATKTAASWDTTTAYFGSDTTSNTTYSITAAGSSGNITNGDGLIHFSVIAGNNATFGTPTITATGATIGTVTESPTTEGTTALGSDLEASSASALVTAGTSTADAVCGWTLSAAQTGGSALVRLREASTVVSADASATGTGVAQGSAASSASSAGSADGSSTAIAAGASTSTANASATGTGDAQAAGASVASAAASSDGSSTATAPGAATSTGAGSSTGEGIATGAGSSTATAAASSDGIGTATGAGAVTVAAAASATGTSDAQATGTSTASAAASSEGTSTAVAVGLAESGGTVVSAAGSSAGESTATAAGAAAATSAAQSAGVADAIAAGAAATTAAASATGVADAQAAGAATAAAAAYSEGTGTATAAGGTDSSTNQILYWGDKPRDRRKLMALQNDDEDIIEIIHMYMAMEETWQTSRRA